MVELRPEVLPPVPAIETQPIPEGLPAKRAAIESFINDMLFDSPSAFAVGLKSSLSDSQSIPANAKVAATISWEVIPADSRTRSTISIRLI